ncbi:MAG: ATP-binding protein [Deltaproteobacteria bacterium]|nr:ATP-binding protein [Deltaproteobacteria bacterium]
MRTGTITLAIDSQLDSVFLVGQAVAAICGASPLGAAKAREVEAAVVEAVNNAIEHAYGNQSGHRVEVVIELQAGCVVCRVCDRGRTMQQSPSNLAEAAGEGAEEPTEGGRGFMIMRSLMDQVSYARAGDQNVLTLVKTFDPTRVSIR